MESFPFWRLAPLYIATDLAHSDAGVKPVGNLLHGAVYVIA